MVRSLQMTDPPLAPHPLSYAPPPTRQSLAGIISFVCGLLALLSICLSFIAAQTLRGGIYKTTRFVGILIFAVIFLGLVSGILGILPPRRKRALASIGLVLNFSLLMWIMATAVVVWRRSH